MSSQAKSKSVLVHVVTYNHGDVINACLDALDTISPAGLSLQIEVTDNCSSDDTVFHLQKRQAREHFRFFLNPENTGFSHAHNQAVQRVIENKIDYLLVLNPDVRLESPAIQELVSALEFDLQAGTATPKLFRSNHNLDPVQPRCFDACGMFITPSLRHFDRGSNQLDRGQYDEPAYVFGGTGACLLIKREFLVDVCFDTHELFDNSFFAYREDADLAWRALLYGWKCRYVPKAIGYHRRVVLPERRKSLPPALNHASVRNRFLMQINQFHPLDTPQALLPGLLRNLLVVLGSIVFERSSLSAFKELMSLWSTQLQRRALIQAHRKIGPGEVLPWFASKEYSQKALAQSQAPEKIRTIHAVIIDYKSPDRVERLLQSLKATTLPADLSFSYTVVDNSTDNRGFAGGINSCLKGRHDDAFLILNPDLTLEPASLQCLVNDLNQYENLAVVAPVLHNQDYSLQLGFTARRLPTLGSTLSELLGLKRLWPKNPWTSSYHLSDIPKNSARALQHDLPQVVEQPAGACLLIRRKAYEILDGFDQSFYPAWYEDVDFLKRLSCTRFVAALSTKTTTAGSRVIHEGGHSLTALKRSDFYKIWFKNMARYWWKHGNFFEIALLMPTILLAWLLRTVFVNMRTILSSK